MKIIIFMIEVDQRSHLLASNFGWLNSFSRLYEKLLIVATHVGELPYDFPSNAALIELGGGSYSKRLRAIWRLIRIVYKVRREASTWHVLHHMVHHTVLFPGIVFKFLGYPQALWYSHKSKPLFLQSASRIVDVVTSTSKTSFPLNGEVEVTALGHGIDRSKFLFMNSGCSARDYKSSIIYLGRISRIKNLEKLLTETSLLKKDCDLDISFIGPIMDPSYVNELLDISKNEGITINFMNPIDYTKVPGVLNKFSYFFSGTELSLDKAALEAAMCGCLVVTENRNLMEAVGMDSFWSTKSVDINSLKISDQLFFLEQLTPEEKFLLRKLTAEHTYQFADVNKATLAIHDLLAAKKRN